MAPRTAPGSGGTTAARSATKPKPRSAASLPPTLRHERVLSAEGARWVIGCDEVGRGAIAGPVAVGLCVADISRRVPKGLRDSKLLSEPKRVELRPVVARWAVWSAVGMASNAEVDDLGLTAALGLAGIRAFESLCESGFDPDDSVVLLDGKFDWFSPAARAASLSSPPPVSMRIKADMTCASVSAASVLAKVERDELMISHHRTHPDYGWASNKGYGSAAHWAAIERRGASPLHRHTWLRTPTLFDEMPTSFEGLGQETGEVGSEG